jgi:DNA-binding transcriptional LysR family regulator
MELRHLRYFIAAAELRSVRAASEQLHVTQPAVSRQIHALEETIGAKLFQRTPRGLRLTPAGNVYLEEARAILAQVHTANHRARRIATGEEGHLRVGFVENAVWSGLVSEALSGFKQTLPKVSLELVPMNTPEQLCALEDGRLDGGFCYRVGPLPPGISSVPVLEQNVVLAVPAAWPIAKRKIIDASKLKALPFIALPRPAYPAYYDLLVSTCAERGVTLDIRQEASTETAILSLVAAGVGAAIVNSANRSRQPERVEFIDLKDLSIPLPLDFCFMGGVANTALRRFVELLR